MAVLVRMTAAGMDAATYDQASTQLADLVKKQPGFMMHVAYPSPGGSLSARSGRAGGSSRRGSTRTSSPTCPESSTR